MKGAAAANSVRPLVLRLVQETFADESVTRELFESRYFSSFFRFTLAGGAGPRTVLVKLPKAQMQRGHRTVPDRTAADLIVARREFEALTFLNDCWLGRSSQVVPVQAFDSNVGAIVMPEIGGLDLWKVWFSDRRRTRASVVSLGQDLAAYHNARAEIKTYGADTVITKISRLIDVLELLDVGPIKEAIDAVALNERLPPVQYLIPGIKGFEIRNIRLDDQNRMWLLDPGKLKWEPPEADVARFTISCRMLFWGSSRFALRQGPIELMEAFLDGYRSKRDLNMRTFSLFEIREALKNWIAGVKQTQLKPLPTLIRTGLLRFYTNPGFKSVLQSAIKALSRN